jgi:NADPH:quinone reductase-like Zn-dependent oxidoreductase
MLMSKAVRFDHYGPVEVLRVVEVQRPGPGVDEVLVRVKAAGTNPGEISIREGLLHDRFPATFPSGEGTDLAGIVEEIGEGVEQWQVGDEVIGFTERRASHAELVAVEAEQLTPRPPELPWEVAGGLFVAGVTAYAAVRAVAPAPGDRVVVSGAAGGVGSLAVQLARNAGASVIGLAGEHNHSWLSEHGVIPISYGEGVAERIREAAPDGVDAFLDTFGGGYIELAVSLGVAPERIDTIIDYQAAEKYGAKTEASAAASSAEVLRELAGLIVQGKLEVPIAHTYPLE